MEKNPLNSCMILTRIIAAVLLIGSTTCWFMWRINEDYPVKKQTFAFPRLQQQSEILCEWPKFSIWEDNFENSTISRRVECRATQNSFAFLDSFGYLTVTTPESPDYSETRCFYRSLAGNQSTEAPTQIQFNRRSKADHNQFVVSCLNGTDTIYEEAFFNPSVKASQLVPSNASTVAEKFAAADPMRPSIAILLIDDVSSAAFARNLPKTTTLMREADFFVPSRYSQSFPDAAANLELLLNGNDSTSLVEMMKARGCLTLSNEEFLPYLDEEESLFASAHLNTRAVHAFNHKTRANEHCLANGKSTVSSVLAPLLSFSSTFSHLCTLSITRLRSAHHHLGAVDEELSSALAQLLAAASNTAVFVLSPSGRKGRGLSGVVEGRSPLLAAWFPGAFRQALSKLIQRNEHYSTFAWNMDKLITTRDVRETLRQLAEGRLPEAIEWRYWDEEHHQASSLLGEMLPEARNCTTLDIADASCLCMAADERRNATANAEGILYKRVFELIESRAVREPCIDGIEADPESLHVNAYRMREEEVDQKDNDVEWLTIKFYARIREQHLNHGGNYGSGSENYVWFKTTVRHYISSGRLEYVDALIIKSRECFAVHLERLCSICYSARFWSLSAVGPNKGFLLDTATNFV